MRKEIDAMNFAERLKNERKKQGWSQEELAEKLYVSRQSVSKWENGQNYPSIALVGGFFWNFAPLILMIGAGIGSDVLKNKYKEE